MRYVRLGLHCAASIARVACISLVSYPGSRVLWHSHAWGGMVHHHNQVSSDYADWLTVPAKQFQSTDKVNGDAVPQPHILL